MRKMHTFFVRDFIFSPRPPLFLSYTYIPTYNEISQIFLHAPFTNFQNPLCNGLLARKCKRVFYKQINRWNIQHYTCTPRVVRFRFNLSAFSRPICISFNNFIKQRERESTRLGQCARALVSAYTPKLLRDFYGGGGRTINISGGIEKRVGAMAAIKLSGRRNSLNIAISSR